MNALNYLIELARLFAEIQLDAVMIGNAAAFINGAPVTTMDVDFMLKKTDENYRKLAALAQRMNCKFVEVKLTGENYMYQLEHRTEPLRVDFLFVAAGIESFETLKERGTNYLFGEHPLRIASLEDVVKSKRTAGRLKDLAVIPILELTLKEKASGSKSNYLWVKEESVPYGELPKPIRIEEDHDVSMIQYLLSFPPNKRTSFLRIPLPNGGSAI